MAAAAARRLQGCAAIALLLALPGCASARPAEPPSGVWGGGDLVATFTDGGARLVASCAQGFIAGPLRPDGSGRFTATGAFQAFHGGPQRADEEAPSPTARFTGRITGDTLSLRVLAPPDPPRDYRLKRGVAPRLVRCL